MPVSDFFKTIPPLFKGRLGGDTFLPTKGQPTCHQVKNSAFFPEKFQKFFEVKKQFQNIFEVCLLLLLFSLYFSHTFLILTTTLTTISDFKNSLKCAASYPQVIHIFIHNSIHNPKQEVCHAAWRRSIPLAG